MEIENMNLIQILNHLISVEKENSCFAEKVEKESVPEKEPQKNWPMVCCECGKASTVPFKPQNPDNLTCKDCYYKRQNGNNKL